MPRRRDSKLDPTLTTALKKFNVTLADEGSLSPEMVKIVFFANDTILKAIHKTFRKYLTI